MNDYFGSLESEGFTDPFAGEAGADSLGWEPEQFNVDGFGPEGFGAPDGFGSYDAEADQFFKKAFKGIGRFLKNSGLPALLPQLAPIAAKIAGGGIGGPLGAQVAGMVGGLLKEEEGFDFEEEFEFEAEEEDGILREDEAEAFGLDQYTDGLAEQFAAMAADSESEAEASALLGGVTIHIISPAPVQVKRVSPVLVKSATRLGRFLRRRRRTRPLLKAIPTIQRKAVQMLTQRAKAGAPITPAVARKAMASATVRTLRTPKAAAKGLANNAVKRQRLARVDRKALARVER